MGVNPQEIAEQWPLVWVKRLQLVRRAHREAQMQIAQDHKCGMKDVADLF